MKSEAVTGFRLSPQQRALWAQRRASAADYAQVVVRCGRRTPADVRAAWDAIAGRHSILRTRFVRPEGLAAPLQVVSDPSEVAWRTLDAQTPIRELQPLLDDERGRAAAAESARACTVDLDDGALALLLTLPRLMADGGSIGQIAADLNGCAVDGDPPPDYVTVSALLDEIASELDTGDRIAGERFWSEQSAAVHRPIPWHHRGPTDAGVASLPNEATSISAERLESCTSTLNVSATALLVTAWSIVLARLSGWGNLRLAVALDGRGDVFDGIVGPLDRVVPLGTMVRASETFAVLAKRIEESLASARLPHVLATWDARCAAVESEPYVIEYERRNPDVALRRPAVGSAALWVVGAHTASRFEIEAHYDRALFSADAVERLRRYLQHTLTAAIVDPECPVASLSLIDETQAKQLLSSSRRRGQATQYAYIHQRISEHARTVPDDTAVVDEHESLTYAQLNRRSNQLAHLLREAGAAPEARVAICLERSAAAIVAIVAVLKAGAAYVPLEPSHPGDRLRDLIAEAAPVAVLGDAASLQRLGTLPDAVRAIDLDRDRPHIAARLAVDPALELHPENLAYLMFTSGSTGRPKAVAVEHGQLAAYVEGITARLGLERCGSFATVTTLAADLGHTAVFAALANGAMLHVISPLMAGDAAGLAAYMERHAIDCLKIVPSHLRALLDVPDPHRLTPKRLLVLGGEACPWPLVQQVRALAPQTEIANHYGPTETTVGALTSTVEDGRIDGAMTVPIGTPLAHADAFVLDERMQPVPCGVPGELYIGGETVTRGYFRRPELTADRYVPSIAPGDAGARLYRTGDLVRRWEDGSIEFLRRADRQIKLRGFRVEPAEIESALRAVPGVADAAVVLREQPVAKLLAFVTSAAGATLDPVAVKRAAARALPEHMVPASVRVLASLPVTVNGKIDRDALARRDDAEESRAIYAAPQTEVEQVVAGIWSDLLKVSRVGLDDNFFDLGGHSLLMVQVHARLEQRFGHRLSMVDLFRHTTVRRLAAFLSPQPAALEAAPVEAGAATVAAARRSALEQMRERRTNAL